MNKKGAEIATSTIVMILLGLAVLIILIMVFRQQIAKGAQQYANISSQTTLSSDSCASIILGRACSDTCDPAKGQREVFSPSGQWKDCGSKKCCEAA